MRNVLALFVAVVACGSPGVRVGTQATNENPQSGIASAPGGLTPKDSVLLLGAAAAHVRLTWPSERRAFNATEYCGMACVQYLDQPERPFRSWRPDWSRPVVRAILQRMDAVEVSGKEVAAFGPPTNATIVVNFGALEPVASGGWELLARYRQPDIINSYRLRFEWRNGMWTVVSVKHMGGT